MMDSEYAHAAYYDLVPGRFGAPDREAMAEIDFYASFATGGEALEIGAGTGRLAIALAERGIRVWAIEPAAGMRAVCLVKAIHNAAPRERLTILAGDGATFRLGRRVQYIYACNIHEHLSYRREWPDLLANVSSHLEDGGSFVINGISTRCLLSRQPRGRCTDR